MDWGDWDGDGDSDWDDGFIAGIFMSDVTDLSTGSRRSEFSFVRFFVFLLVVGGALGLYFWLH